LSVPKARFGALAPGEMVAYIAERGAVVTLAGVVTSGARSASS
jgi:hypothetical protein